MESVTDQTTLLWIVLLPLIGAIINGLFGRSLRKSTVTFVGVGTVAASFVLACMAFGDLWDLKHAGTEKAALVYHFYEWFSLSIPGSTEVAINVRFLMDSLSGVMTLVVTGVGGLIHLYAVGYIEEDKGYARFFSYLNLFTASMLILVLASNLPLMFVGWEGVGLCSYLLIGFWYENRDYAAAGRKAFVANRIGDFGVLIAMFIIMLTVGSFEFVDVNAAAADGVFSVKRNVAGIAVSGQFPVQFLGLKLSIATVTGLFLFLGCTGKSAQIPLFVWLPDAMAGPTPVSALIHAATMVTAGVYLCCRLSPLFIASNTVMAVIAVIGTLTALLAATIAVVQNEMKKILAYSTVSQLGFMFAAVGVGFFAAGFFHVFTHAFFKACLFLGAGSVMHAVHAHGDADIRKLGGLKKWMPITRWTFLFSCLAIAGVPPFSGFFSKDEILLGAAAQAMGHNYPIGRYVGWFVLIGLSIAAILTAFYMFRLYFLTFTGEYRSSDSASGGDGASDHHDDHHGYDPHPHESPASMAFPLFVLGAGALAAGWVGLPHIVPFVGAHLPNWWGHWMEASVASAPIPGDGDMNVINLAGGLGLAAAAIGVGLAFVAFRNKQDDTFTTKLPKAIHSFLFDKWRVDELYDATVIGPIKKVATLTGHADQTFVDALLTKVPSVKVQLFGNLFAKLQNGVLHSYGAVLGFGLLAVMWWFWQPHASIDAQIEGQSVELAASPGLGYSYRWDANSDGTFETDWSTKSTHRYAYQAHDIQSVALNMTSRAGESKTMDLDDEYRPLNLAELDPDWKLVDANGPPFARHDGGIVVRRLVEDPMTGKREETTVTRPVGHPFRLGTVTVSSKPIVVATVEVKNAFGAVTREQIEIALPSTPQGTETHAALGVKR